jgi:predicted metal-dependent phosphoesterase TrpH
MVAISPMLSSAAQNTLSLQRVWEAIDVNSCPYQYNFHLHTVASDGKLTPLELVQQALDINLKGFAITDHHSVNGYQQAQTYLNQLKQKSPTTHQLTLWTGIEITARLLQVDVHILGYTFDPQHPALKPYLQSCNPSGKDAEAKKVIHSIHEAGGLAVLAHPHRYRRSANELISLAAEFGIDGVEAYYAYENPRPWRPSPKKTEEIQQLASYYNLYTTCGTDTHGTNILQRL